MTTTTINVFDLGSASKGSKEGIEKTASIPLPTLGPDPVTFRSAKCVSFASLASLSASLILMLLCLRFNRHVSPNPMIHAIINTNPKPLPRGKGKRPTVIKKGYCVNFTLTDIASASKQAEKAADRRKWEMVGKREVGNVPVSAFEIRSVRDSTGSGRRLHADSRNSDPARTGWY